MSRNSKFYREYDEETGKLIKLECSHCREIKDVSCFSKNKSKKDSVRTECRQCVSDYNRQWRENNPDYNSQYSKNHKEEKSDYNRQWYENKMQQEKIKICENVTKQLYPHEGVQYGIIYGVVCKVTNRWYIGQTTSSFNIRYKGDFFNRKTIELSNDSIKGQLLQDDIEKYDKESFEIFEVLDVAFSEKELDEKEAYYIDLYKAYDEGYNSNRGNIFKHGKEKRMCCCE